MHPHTPRARTANNYPKKVSIVAFKRSGLVVKAHAWDRNAGGRDLDELLFDHFVAEFKAKTKLDVASNAKAAFKLRAAVDEAQGERWMFEAPRHTFR